MHDSQQKRVESKQEWPDIDDIADSGKKLTSSVVDTGDYSESPVSVTFYLQIYL
jgi:hypothetical protein